MDARLDLTQAMSWPGAKAIVKASYSASHGETPGVGMFSVRLPPNTIKPIGDFEFKDGKSTLKLFDCKIIDVDYSRDSDGDLWSIRFADRRWRWAESGAISGHFNELDRNGKLVPWKIASPEEIARFCLEKMGERNFEIDLPPGLESKNFINARDYFQVGINAPPTGTNPEIEWQDLRPSAALSELCDRFERRLVFDPVKNRVIIARPGIGEKLPRNGYMKQGANIEVHPTPEAVGVVGSPAVFQVRLPLVPVMRDWHNYYMPPDKVSYRPWNIPNANSRVYRVMFVEGLKPDPGNNVGPPSVFVSINNKPYFANGLSNPAIVASFIHNLIQADPKADVVSTLTQGATLILAGKGVGNHDIQGSGIGGVDVRVVPIPPNDSGWGWSMPPSFHNVQPTDRLTYTQARQLAAESAFRCYRIADYREVVRNNQGVLERVKAPLFVPGYGSVLRRQQLLLQNVAVEQVVPQPVDVRIFERNQPIPGVVWDFYNGYSRARAAAVYGSISQFCNGYWWVNAREDTPAAERINIPFQIDPINQVLTFARPVFRMRKATDPLYNTLGPMMFPDLVLEVGVQVLEPKTHEVVRYRRWFSLKDGVQDNKKIIDLNDIDKKAESGVFASSRQPPRWTEWHPHEDVWYEVVGNYKYQPVTKLHELVNTTLVDDVESAKRANYYLEGHVLAHIIKGGEVMEYAGVRLISLDGAIQSVSWSIGPSGPVTTASHQMEHAPFIAPYPARRRAENLKADSQAKEFNRRSNHLHATESDFKKQEG